ncbi:MAG: hypothetical protein M3Y03_05395 [Verrucomicrobiota bacterium]|nr:hypothetical protein [Verrucomicrobiota bacterium]
MTVLRRRIAPGKIPAIFELDSSIAIAQGVVTLTLPKAEQVRPRKIAVS